MGNDLEKISDKEIVELDTVAQDIITYSEDDRRKADDLFQYYQELITGGDAKGETRVALAKSLELREKSVENLIEILKLKTRIIEKKLTFEMKKISNDDDENTRRSGTDTSKIISRMEEME
jgi:hypothetical protein